MNKFDSPFTQRKKDQVVSRNIIAMLFRRARGAEKRMKRAISQQEGKTGQAAITHDNYITILTSEWASVRNAAVQARSMLDH